MLCRRVVQIFYCARLTRVKYVGPPYNVRWPRCMLPSGDASCEKDFQFQLHDSASASRNVANSFSHTLSSTRELNVTYLLKSSVM